MNDELKELMRQLGSMGGTMRAKKLSKEKRSEIAKVAAEKRWGKVRVASEMVEKPVRSKSKKSRGLKSLEPMELTVNEAETLNAVLESGESGPLIPVVSLPEIKENPVNVESVVTVKTEEKKGVDTSPLDLIHPVFRIRINNGEFGVTDEQIKRLLNRDHNQQVDIWRDLRNGICRTLEEALNKRR